MAMRRSAITLIVAILAAAGAAPSSRAGSERLTLGRTTVLRGDTSYWIPVRIPRRATLTTRLHPTRPRGPNRAISITGAGRAVGFALTHDPPDAAVDPVVVGVRLARCARRGCGPGAGTMNFMLPFGFGSSARPLELAPGRYRLYLIADGAPARVTVELDGLSGRRHIGGGLPAPVHVRTPRPTRAIAGPVRYHAGGTVYRAGREGFFVAALYARGPALPRSAWGLCAYAPGARHHAAYGPGCVALGRAGAASYAAGAHSGSDQITGFWVVVLGRYPGTIAASPSPRRGLGGWLTADRRVSDFGLQGVFVSYDGRLLLPASSRP